MISLVVIVLSNALARGISRFQRGQNERQKITKNAFDEKLYDYLTSTQSQKCIVVTAAWGQGKSYLIRKFMSEFMRYRWNHVYTVSCFGIEDRGQLKELLENEMYCVDDSVNKMFFLLFENIPVIGPMITLLREQKYSIKKISKKDIIILEDIERMSPPGNVDKEKLNILAGFINELIERYNNKVIVVCSEEEFKNPVYQECIYKKLACEEVTIPNENNLIAFMEECFAQKNISDKNINLTREILEENENISNCFLNILNKANIKNKRLIQKVFTDQANFCKHAKNWNKEIATDFMFSYLLWEIAKETKKENETDAEQLLEYLKEMKDTDTYVFPELYLNILKDKNNLKISGNEWWHCLIYFPKEYYWVGISALETYAKETNNIHSSRKIDIIKMPYDVEGRTQANCWKIIETIKGADNQGEEQLNAIREAVKNVKIDFDKEGITVETNQQFFRDYYVIFFLVKCYLFEAYGEKYEHLVAKRIRKFIMETYKLLRVDFISNMEGYITLYYSSNSGFLINDMNKRRDEIVKKDCKEKQKMDEPNVLMEQNKENKRFTQFTNVVTANVDREKKNDPIKQD